MAFWRKSQEEMDAKAALAAAKANLHTAKTQVKTARTVLRTAKATRKTRRLALRTQSLEEHEEARYVTAMDRLDRDRRRGRAKPVRVRGSRRARRYRRSRPR